MSSSVMTRKISLNGANGINIIGDIGGPDHAPLVILSHGGGQTRHSWSSTAKGLLEAGYAVFAYDLRGHGESDWDSNGAYSAHDYVDDMDAIIRQIGKGRQIALVGLSLGGMMSLIAASKHNDQIDALVMVDVSPRVAISGADRIRTFMMAHPDGFETLDDAAVAVAAYRNDNPRQSNPSRLKRNLRLNEKTGRYHWHWDPRVLEGLPPESREPRRIAMEAACRTIKAKVFLVRGLQSDVVTPEEAAEFKALLPDLEMTDIAGAGHMVVGDRHDAFQDAIVDFLSRIMPAKV